MKVDNKWLKWDEWVEGEGKDKFLECLKLWGLKEKLWNESHFEMDYWLVGDNLEVGKWGLQYGHQPHFPKELTGLPSDLVPPKVLYKYIGTYKKMGNGGQFLVMSSFDIYGTNSPVFNIVDGNGNHCDMGERYSTENFVWEGWFKDGLKDDFYLLFL